MEGPAGTGKTLVALQVANNLVESSKGEGEVDEPVLVVTAYRQTGEEFIMKCLDSSAGARAIKYFNGWDDIREEFGVPEWGHRQLLLMAEAFAERWKGKEIVMLVDEILDQHVLIKLEEQIFPDSVRMILVVNPVSESSLTLPPSFLHVTLTTPYRSTRAITTLVCFIAKCRGLAVPEGGFGSDVEGTKPIFFDVGKEDKNIAKGTTDPRVEFILPKSYCKFKHKS